MNRTSFQSKVTSLINVIFTVKSKMNDVWQLRCFLLRTDLEQCHPIVFVRILLHGLQHYWHRANCCKANTQLKWRCTSINNKFRIHAQNSSLYLSSRTILGMQCIASRIFHMLIQQFQQVAAGCGSTCQTLHSSKLLKATIKCWSSMSIATERWRQWACLQSLRFM